MALYFVLLVTLVPVLTLATGVAALILLYSLAITAGLKFKS